MDTAHQFHLAIPAIDADQPGAPATAETSVGAWHSSEGSRQPRRGPGCLGWAPHTVPTKGKTPSRTTVVHLHYSQWLILTSSPHRQIVHLKKLFLKITLLSILSSGRNSILQSQEYLSILKISYGRKGIFEKQKTKKLSSNFPPAAITWHILKKKNK